MNKTFKTAVSWYIHSEPEDVIMEELCINEEEMATVREAAMSIENKFAVLEIGDLEMYDLVYDWAQGHANLPWEGRTV